MDEWLYHSLCKLHLQPQQQKSRRTVVSRMQPDSALMHTAGCPYSPPGLVTECLAQGPTKKQVCFNLTKVLDSTPPLPNDWAHFLGETTDEQIDGPCPPAPLDLSSLRWPHDGDDQCHDNPLGGAWTKTHTTPSNQPTVTCQARTRHSASPDPRESPWTGLEPTWVRKVSPQAGGWSSSLVVQENTAMPKNRSWQ